jgi:hypothetical protein
MFGVIKDEKSSFTGISGSFFFMGSFAGGGEILR